MPDILDLAASEDALRRSFSKNKVSNDVLNIVRVIALVLLALLIGSVLLW